MPSRDRSNVEAVPIPTDPAELRGRTVAWSARELIVLILLAGVAIALRGWRLSAEGFADDEVHKWLAAQRYLLGDFGGDDLEHPMLMKWLVAGAIVLGRGALAPETLTRLPNVVVGGCTVLAVALLGRRLFGRGVGVVAAALTAVGPTMVGYTRLAKEDALCTLFLVLLLWCLAEADAAAADARASAQRRWETSAAAFLGLMFASKYFLFFALIPLVAWISLRLGGSPWQIPLRRWAFLLAVALAVFVPLDFVVLRPGTWEYVGHYLRGDAIEDRMTSESVFFMGRHYANFAFQLRGGPPLTYWPIFAAVKLSPPVVLLAAAGLVLAVVKRRPADRILLAWIGVWLFSFTVASVKYGRYFLSVLPALLLLASGFAASAAAWCAGAVRRFAEPTRPEGPARGWPLAALGTILVVTELAASLAVAPHFRLYVNGFGGGERNVAWFFPQCDYADAGAREAVRFIARQAEPGAEIASEIVWPVRYYAELERRPDLEPTHLSPRSACRHGRVCYVIVQEGRTYWHNAAALARLSSQPPWHVERIRGAEVVRVFRLQPGDRLF